jgi:hypothetical protein
MIEFMQATDITGMVVWFFMLFIFMFIYPRLMLSQLIYKLDQSAKKIEDMSEKANAIVLKHSSSGKKHDIDEFTNLFVVTPSSIDPYGLVQKIDQTIKAMETRFEMFANSITTGKTQRDIDGVNYGLRAAVGLRQISKQVRHFVEMSKKFKNLQIAMILQMQLPIIEKIAESELRGTEAFVRGWPVGDSIGPLMAASYIKKSKIIADDIAMGETVIKGRKCFVLKATGPGPHLGRTDEAIELIMKKNKISRVITVDAGLKLEGEKSGSVAEGVGFAMGGIGQRELIENVLLPKKIPIDSVVIKVGMEEAIMPMKKNVFASLQKAREYTERAVERAPKNGKIIIVGVGNSCGIGNDHTTIKDVKAVVTQLHHAYKKEAASKKKGGWF